VTAEPSTSQVLDPTEQRASLHERRDGRMIKIGKQGGNGDSGQVRAMMGVQEVWRGLVWRYVKNPLNPCRIRAR
jgi:hypothetical protein